MVTSAAVGTEHGGRLEGSLMYDVSRRVLYLQEAVEVPLHSALQEDVAIIDTSTNNGSCDRFHRLKGERQSQMSQRLKVEITCTDDVSIVLII